MKSRILLGLCLTSLLLTAGARGAPAPQDPSVGQTTPPLLTPEPPKWEDSDRGVPVHWVELIDGFPGRARDYSAAHPLR